MSAVALRAMPAFGGVAYNPSLEGFLLVHFPNIFLKVFFQTISAMENNATCFISALTFITPCLFAITSQQQSLVKQTITEAQSEFVRVCRYD